MNIIEAIIRFNRQLIIYISGLPGSGKTFQAKQLSKDLKINVIYINDYYKEYQKRENYISDNTTDNTIDNTIDNRTDTNNNDILDTIDDIKLQNDKYVKNQYSTKLLDIEKLNQDIDKLKSNGLIISGFPLPKDIINATIDFHIHISINQTTYIEYQQKKKNPLDINDIELKYQKVIKPYYMNIIQNLNINKFINLKKFESKEKLYDEIWNLSIDYIKKWLKKKNPDCSFE
jgi:uridine kinase